jgi:putative ABC transport system substrate-binding protein
VALEYRFAEGHFDRMPALAADLVRRQVAVIFSSNTPAARAAKEASTTIPIVFSAGGDPVQLGLVGSLNRPGANLTGVYQSTTALDAKRLELLHELIPRATTIAALVNPNYFAAETQRREVQEAALRLGLEIIVLSAIAEGDFESVFATLLQRRAGALLVCASPFFYNRYEHLLALAGSHAVPAIYEWHEFAEAGGLMSYGARLADAYHLAGVYVGRILKGAKPADLPIVQASRFELVINLKTARALAITIPPALLARADEIIE